jgi:hypothetical protein
MSPTPDTNVTRANLVPRSAQNASRSTLCVECISFHALRGMQSLHALRGMALRPEGAERPAWGSHAERGNQYRTSIANGWRGGVSRYNPCGPQMRPHLQIRICGALY